jgi:heme/copper-type cytochrome/quinol oxidase subunit 2
MSFVQRLLIAVGAVLLVAGIFWPWLAKLGLGRLPGDIRIETENGFFYFPITTCVIISIVISLVVWFVRR